MQISVKEERLLDRENYSFQNREDENPSWLVYLKDIKACIV